MSVTDEVRAGAGPDGPWPPDGSGRPDGPRRDGPGRRDEPAPAEGRFDKTPPQDVAAEQCVLGGMLLSKDAIADVVEILKANDFYRPIHAVIFEAILDLYGRGEPADAITVAAALADSGDLGRVGGAPYLHTLIASVPTAANAAYYARIVGERAVLRRLVEAGTKIVQLGYGSGTGGGRDVDDVVDLAQQAVYDVTERRVSEDFAVLADLLQPTLDEIEAVGAQGGVMTGVPTGFTDLDRLLNGLHPGQLIIVAGRPGLGKALALDTPLPTPDGWTTMGEVQAGDWLLGADGEPTRVVHAFDVLHGRRCYEVEFSDGSVIVADAEHLWATTTRAARRQRSENRSTHQWEPKARAAAATAHRTVTSSPDRLVTYREAAEIAGPEFPHVLHVVAGAVGSAGTVEREYIRAGKPWRRKVAAYPSHALFDALLTRVNRLMNAESTVEHSGVVTTEHIVATVRHPTDGRANHAVNNAQPLHLPTRDDLPIPPYTLGVWLGDGRSAGAAFTSADPEVGKHIEADAFALTRSFARRLRAAGVLNHEHIPRQYLRASEDQRRALLAGLLDTGGTVANGGNVEYTSTSRQLAEDVYELIVTLGYRCSMKRMQVKGRRTESSIAYTLNFSTSDEVFSLTRKREAHAHRRAKMSRAGARSRYIVDVRPVPSVPVRCVTVDNPQHLYLAGRSMIPTHNSTASMDFARNASIRANHASAIFSLEMSKVEIVMRLLSAEARVPLHVLRSGQLSDDDWTKLARCMGEISEAPLFVDDTPNMNLMEIRAKSRRLKQRHDLKMIVVDYLQLMSSPKRTESRQQEVAELSRGLKLLAKEVECPVIAVSQLNRGPEQRTDKRPQLSDLRESGCMTEDTTLLRADTGAPVTFGELLREGHEGTLVWSLDEERRMTAAPVTAVFPSGVKATYRLVLASGREVKASGNHPFLTCAGWRPLDDLAVGHRIAIPRLTPEPLATQQWPEAEIIMLAHLIGDGSFVRRQAIRYASVDQANLAAVTDAAAHFGITPVADKYEAARVTTLRLPAPYRLTHGRRNPIAQWLDRLGLFGLRSYEKFVPAEVFSLPNSQLALFLRHLWATDGSIWLPKGGSAAKAYYASSSRRLADDVMRLLSRFGIVARLKRVTKAGYRPGYHVVVSDTPSLVTFCRDIGVHGSRGDQARRLGDLIGTRRTNTNLDTLPLEVWQLVKAERIRASVTERQLQDGMGQQYCGSSLYRTCPSRERLTRIAEVLDSDLLRAMASDDVYWDRIVKIEPLGDMPVYDATVKGTHNFVADGIIAHNSIEQDADVVILLHRDDYYDKESPRAGEADFIVAKHRNGPTDTVTVAAQLHLSRFVDMAIV